MAIDAQWSSVVLLCPFSSDLSDAKSTALAPVGNVAISAAVGTPFGAGNAAAFDGTGDYIPLLDGSQWAFGTGDFTVEAWVYPTSFPGGGNDMLLFGSFAGAPYPLFVIDASTGVLKFQDGASTHASSSPVVLNVWNYVVASRVSGVLKLGIGGVEKFSGAYTTNFTKTTGFAVGGLSSGRYLFGYLGPVRITNGVGRGVTTLPAAPFPRPMISGTVYDDLGAEVDNVVVALKRGTLALAGYAVSDAVTGEYTIYPADFSEHVVMRFDTATYPLVDGGSGENAAIYDRVIPG